jgi:hypothetical protein
MSTVLTPKSAAVAAFAALAALVMMLAPAGVRAEDVRVTVLAILAGNGPAPDDARLKDLAAEVKKREPSLQGATFHIGKTVTKEVNVGQKEAVELIKDKAAADVKVLAKNNSTKRVTLEVKPPLGGAFTYETNYDKYFPYVTRQVVDGERLIIAVMVKPGGEKPAKQP